MDYTEMAVDFLDHWYATVDAGNTVDNFTAYYLPDCVANF